MKIRVTVEVNGETYISENFEPLVQKQVAEYTGKFSLPDHLVKLVTVSELENCTHIKSNMYLRKSGDQNPWSDINEIVKGYGGKWISEKDNWHWEIPKKVKTE